MHALIGSAKEATSTMHLKHPPRTKAASPHRLTTRTDPDAVHKAFAAKADPNRTARFTVLPKGRVR